jgi:hypothetical protein
MTYKPKSSSVSANRHADWVRTRRIRGGCLAFVFALIASAVIYWRFNSNANPLGSLIVIGFLVVVAVLCLFQMPWTSYYKNELDGENYQNWLSWPTLEGYWKQHPETRTPAGPACYYCGSRNLQNIGLCSRTDGDRLIRCRSCGRTLYRI